MSRWIAHYRCRRCEAEWKQEAAPTECPYCKWLWLDWLNYAELSGDK
jgi:Zn finger protein HypA/HybF involved in hydrogenase expression